MSPFKKTILGISTAVTIASPFIPDSVNISVSVPIKIEAQVSKKEKQYNVVTKSCTLEKSFVTNDGVKVCDYACGGSDKQHIYKTYFYKNAVCPKVIQEQIKERSN